MRVDGGGYVYVVVVIDLDSRFFKRARLFSFFPAFRSVSSVGGGWAEVEVLNMYMDGWPIIDMQSDGVRCRWSMMMMVWW